MLIEKQLLKDLLDNTKLDDNKTVQRARRYLSYGNLEAAILVLKHDAIFFKKDFPTLYRLIS